MPTAAPLPPPINAKRSRRHGLVNPPKPDVPPSPPLPPLPPKSPLRARARSSVDTTVPGLLPPADIYSPSSSSSTPTPQPAPMTPLDSSYFEAGISSSPLSAPSSASELTSSLLPSSSSAPSIVYTSPSSTSLSKRTHALKELISSERAYASDLALVRDVYIYLARDPMAPFSAATPPSQPPVIKSTKPRLRSSTSTNSTRPKTAGSAPSTPPISPSPSMQSTRSVSSPSGHASFMPSMRRKTSSPALRRATSGSVTASPQARHKQPLSEEDIRLIFLNLEKLAAVSQDLCLALEGVIGGAADDEGEGLGLVILDFLPRMVPLYKVYIAKHPAAAQHLELITPSIAPYLTTARALTNPHTNAWDLPSLLIKPVQRFLKYPLLLKAIIDATPGEASGSIPLREAQRVAEKACVDINDTKRMWEEVGSVLRSARSRKLAIAQSPLPSRASLPPSIEAWDRQLEQREKLIRRYLNECREWSRSVNRSFQSLVDWAEDNERIMKIGIKEGETDDGRGRWCRSVVDEIQTTAQRTLDARIQGQLAPTLFSLLSAVSSPRLLITALRSSLPQNIAESVQTQLADELPKLNRLADTMFAKCVTTFGRWQAEFWEGVRTHWGTALGEEPGEWLRGFEERAGAELSKSLRERLADRNQRLTPEAVISLEDPPLTSRRRPKDAAELTAQFYGLALASASTNGFDDPDATYVQEDAPDLSRGKLHADQMAEVSGFYALTPAQSSSSVLLPSFNSGIEMSRSTPSLTKDDAEGLIPSLPSSDQPPEFRDESSAFAADVTTLQDGLKGLPLEEALRSLGMQELNLNDDVQAEWEDVYSQRLSQSTEYHTPPETLENGTSQDNSADAKAKGMRRLRPSASAKALSKMFSRSRSGTPEVSSPPQSPPPPLPVPWASSYSYTLPSTQLGEAELAHYHFYTHTQPQQMFSSQPSSKEKVLAFRQHSRVSGSSDSNASKSDPESRRTSSNDQSLPPSSFTPPPQPRAAHFSVSPITAFHLPSPRYRRYTFHGLPFLTLRVGDLITVTQDAGRPTDYRDFPLWTDGREDRLLVGKAEDGNEGWLLASFVIPVS